MVGKKVFQAGLLSTTVGLVSYLILGFSPLSFTVASGGSRSVDLWSARFRLSLTLATLVFLIGGLNAILQTRLISQFNTADVSKLRDKRVKILSYLPTLVVVGLAIVVNTPENRRNTNSRIHWVDYRVGSRQDEWVYIATRILYRIFEPAPWILAGLLAGICALLLRFLSKCVSGSFALTNLAPLALLAPGYSLSMMDLGEDVLVNTTFLLGAISVVLLNVKRPNFRSWLILATILVISSRPFLLLGFSVFCVTVRSLSLSAESVLREDGGSWKIPCIKILRILLVDVVTIATTFFVHQLIFSLIGFSFFDGLKEGSGYSPVEVHSFLLTRFSGAFLGHGMWIYFPLLGLAAVYSSHSVFYRIFAKKRATLGSPASRQRILLGISLLAGWIATLASYDSVILPYYNVRYVHTAAPYMWIFVVVVAAEISGLSSSRQRITGRATSSLREDRGKLSAGLLCVIVVLSLASIGGRDSFSALLDQPKSEFASLGGLRRSGIESELTFISLDKYDLNEVSRALMVSRSSLRVRDQVLCSEDQFFVMRNSDFVSLDESINASLIHFFPPGLVMVACT